MPPFRPCPAPGITPRTTRSGRNLLACCLVLLLVLVACAEGSGPEDERRFANDPVTEEPTSPDDPTAVPSPVATEVGVPTATSPNAALGLLQASGSTDVVVFQHGDTAQMVDPLQPGSGSTVQFTTGFTVLDLAPSPSGGRVAALLRNGEGEFRVEVRNRRGEELAIWDLPAWSNTLATPMAPATPDATGDPGAGNAISWTGGTERVLVTLGGRHLINIPLDGEPTEINLPDIFAGRLITAEWSPVDDRIAVHGVDREGSGTIWTVSPYIDGTSWRQVVPPPADAANLGSVTRFAWLQDGSGLLYILAQDASAANPGGNLYRIDLTSRERQVVATPGRGGPAAQIVDLSVSPDGESVAYVIAFPIGDEWHYHSLWIRSLSSALYLGVDSGGAAGEVIGMWWVGEGFAWQSTGQNGPEVSFAAERTDPTVIWNLELASPEATPVASPILATSEATPIQASPTTASPAAIPIVDTPVLATPDGATPIPGASPVATPVATPAT